MKNFIILSCGLAGILLIGPLVKEAVAVDFTGTWSGTASCAGIVEDSSTGPTDVAITIAISQSGKNLNLDITLVTTDFTSDLNGGPHRYHGTTKGKSRGEITQCGTTFGPKGSFNGVIGDVKIVTSKKDPTPHLEGDLLNLDEPDSGVACVFDGLTNGGGDPGVPSSC